MRYRFSHFTLSPQERLLLRDGQEVPLIPRYFDLLLLLVERRHEAVHRNEIFERVWTDVNVSDSALSQAIRIIRRTLDDDSKEPRFIRTVSRHGYRFVFPDVVTLTDDGPTPVSMATDSRPAARADGPAPGPPTATSRWAGALTGASLAGIAAGSIGGLLLALAPGSRAPLTLAPVLAVIGGVCGAIGAGGVAGGLALADRFGDLPRGFAVVGGTAVGGGLVGLAVQSLVTGMLNALLGLDLAVGGGLEGVVIGAAAGAGLMADRGSALRRSLVAAATCGLAALLLSATGHPLVGGTIHALATASEGSLATLAPLGRLVGEPDFGPISRALIACGEGALFGGGLAAGLARRRGPRRP